MRCNVHIRKSLDFTGKHFVLRIFLGDSTTKEERWSESFKSEGSLIKRLLELEIPASKLDHSLSNLTSGLDVMWTNIEIVPSALGRMGKAAMAECSIVAA
jgi:hypothetical protein